MQETIKPLRSAGIALGIGMGGFADGILFHQILQIHSMLSNRYFPDSMMNMEINMRWDGIFHALTWMITAFGVALLWKAAQVPGIIWSRRYFLGALAMGWGLFNLVEGIIDHHILQIHHVVERAEGVAQLRWDLLFDASGVVLMAIGFFLMKKTMHQVDESRMGVPKPALF